MYASYSIKMNGTFIACISYSHRFSLVISLCIFHLEGPFGIDFDRSKVPRMQFCNPCKLEHSSMLKLCVKETFDQFKTVKDADKIL